MRKPPKEYKRSLKWVENIRRGVTLAHEKDPTLRHRIGHKGDQRTREAIRAGLLRYFAGLPKAERHHTRGISRKAIDAAAAWRRGRPRSEETKAKISQTLKSKGHPPGCKHCEAWARDRFPIPQTRLETRLYALLLQSGLWHARQERFGRYVVDAYLSEAHVAIEADGEYWHGTARQQARDRLRDGYLFRQFGLMIIHVPESTLMEADFDISAFIEEAVYAN
jgi:very-short-patch-repair endonuclease